MPTSEMLPSDLRHGLRTLVRDRGFTATALLIFALCLGANVALFAVVNAVLLKPLPYPHPEQLVTVFNGYPKAGVPRAGSSSPHYLERRGLAAFTEAAATRDTSLTLGEAGSPERIAGMSVTPSFFRVLGVSSALGRTFTDAEGQEGGEKVLILSDGLWREKFGADPAVIGRSVRIDGGAKATVVGVMPASFRYLDSRARVWVPMTFSERDRKPEQRHSNNISMIARLRDGETITSAQGQVDALNRSAVATDPYAKIVADAGFKTTVANLRDDHVNETRPIVLMLQAGVLLLLGIGLVNLANLQLVRFTGRTKELSLRQVLGASGSQLTRQILSETVTLALVGGVLGLGVGWVGLRAISHLGVDKLPRSGDLSIDPTVCLVALLASLIVGVLLALPVLWQVRRGNLAAALSVESRGGTTSRATNRLRHILISAQIALAFVLLVSAGLLGLSFSRVLAVNPGFQPEQVLTGSVEMPTTRYKETDARRAFVQRLTQELQAGPGISAVGIGTMLPFSGGSDVNAITVEGHPPAPGESLKAHYMGGVSGDYFTALGIRLIEGRFINSDDDARKAQVCVVDETVARLYWPNGGAIGGRLYNGVPGKEDKVFTIVGVVAAIKQDDLVEQRANGAVYIPYSLYSGRSISVAVKTTQAVVGAAPFLRSAVLRVDSDVPMTDVKPLTTRISDSLERRRSPLLLAGIFAGLALLLVTVGLYSVLAYAVAQRRREIGVRMALGAQPANIRTQFLGLGARLTIAGVAFGAVVAWYSGQAMRTLLFGVSPQQPVVFAGTFAVLAAVALTACLLPAVRAARVPPLEALRSE